MTIVFDTETTGLLAPAPADIDQQPHMTEIYCIKLNDKMEMVDEFETFVKPPIPIPDIITKITGINDQMVSTAPPFALMVDDLVDFMLGEKTIVAHNVSFDMGMLWCELSRLDLQFHFPWPPEWYCTVEKSMYLRNKRLKLSQLHEIATGNEHKSGAHRAKADVHALMRCYTWLKEQGQ